MIMFHEHFGLKHFSDYYCICVPHAVSGNQKVPTYGILIDVFQVYSEDRDKLIQAFKAQFPNIYIGHPDRFYKKVKRINHSSFQR